MGPFEMVVAIVFIATFGTIVRSIINRGKESSDAGTDPQVTRELRGEVERLRERVNTLERIAIEKEDTLSREIDRLRDS